MEHTLVIGGSGGQGVMTAGTLLAVAAIRERKSASCMPSYGPEMRGGTANCTVVIADEAVSTPIPDEIGCVITLNQPSFTKFHQRVSKEGIIILNSSIISEYDDKKKNIIKVPCNEIAHKLGNVRAANMVALGAYIKKTQAVLLDSVMHEISLYFSGKDQVIKINQEAIAAGMNAAI